MPDDLDQQSPSTDNRQAQEPQLVNSFKNFIGLLKEVVEAVNQLEGDLGEISRQILNIKSITPPDRIAEVNNLLHILTGVMKGMSLARTSAAYAMTGENRPFRRRGESVEKSTPTLTEAKSGVNFQIRQTEIAPFERFEVKEEGQGTSVLVLYNPRTGTYTCSSCIPTNEDKHIELVKFWKSRGKPEAEGLTSKFTSTSSPSAAAIDSTLSGGYERPGFWGTGSLSGGVDGMMRQVPESSFLANTKNILESFGFTPQHDNMFTSKDGVHIIFIRPSTESWSHKIKNSTFDMSGQGSNELWKHLQNLSDHYDNPLPYKPVELLKYI